MVGDLSSGSDRMDTASVKITCSPAGPSMDSADVSPQEDEKN